MESSIAGYLSVIGLAIQVFGVAGIAALFLLLHRALPRDYFLLWSKAWLVMAVALISLQLALSNPTLLWPLEIVYFLGEYWFAVLLSAGFHAYPDRARSSAKPLRWPWLLALVWAVLLTQLPLSFSFRFGLHALVFATLLGFALWRLGAIRVPDSYGWAHRFALVSLALLTLSFFVNGAVALAFLFSNASVNVTYSAYQSIIDLLLEVLLAFSLVAVAAVDMRSTLDRARASMQGERDRMAMLAHQDTLTGCYNRLALEDLKAGLAQRWGSVVMIDLNELKPLNDGHGHALGDLALRTVANALKAALRTHDHVFRIGGDEFLVVTFDLSKDLALQRVRQTQGELTGVLLYPGHIGGLSIAFGAAEFVGRGDFDSALLAADEAMYAHKHRLRASD